MKIQCDVCEKAGATVICCADEAALCPKCDVEVHAANKLASKHQRLHLLHSGLSTTTLPPCDICQEKTAFIFCVEDRALFCKDCDEPIHSATSLAANHQRFLATGIRVGLSASCNKEISIRNDADPKPPKPNVQQICMKPPLLHASINTAPSWAVDELLQFSDYGSPDKKEQPEFNELEWLTDINVFGDEVVSEGTLALAEVPQLPVSQPNYSSYRQSKPYVSVHKKPRFEVPPVELDEEEYFTVPDLG